MEEVRIEVEVLERDEEGVLVKVRRIPRGGKASETLVRVRPGDDLWAAAFRAVRRLRGEQAEA